MNHLVYLDTHAGELEKILSGTKTMLIIEHDPAQAAAQPAHPGDHLYFLRDNGECAVRVKATVIRVLCPANGLNEELSHTLKELQPRLQLTEDQYNAWSAKEQVLLVEFESAHKIGAIQVVPPQTAGRPGWSAFEEAGPMGPEEVSHEHPTLTLEGKAVDQNQRGSAL
ncbi:MAG: hypothetical protein GXY76_09230 [Chloroflexi bacterium]|nr:hypothetical protein [Chloroflexota bacterium]